MASFADLTAQLKLNIQNFARNMQNAIILANKFASNLQGKINTGMVDPTKKAKFEFKDVSRIVQGIIVSKIFYSSLNAIRRATDAVWEFSKELEYAKMVYSNLFGDTELAQEFINVLKDFAAVTPFSFKQSEEAAKRLLAYGIESKNVMFMMQGVLSAATVQGTDAVIEPISRAMGQIYTKGRLMNEEMRQLAEAGIPAYEILQEKLNLTAEELRNLGRTAIPAHIALNALVEGINERFGTTLEFASTTTQGIISNIVDNSTMLFAGIFEPFTEYLRGALGRLGEFINELRSIYELKGIGGVFEKLIPPALQQDIKIFIANLKILWDIIKSSLASAFRILGSLLKGLLYAFNALAPAIYTVVGTLAGLLKIITSNEKLMKGLTTAILAAAAAWVVYKIQAVAASITTVVIKGIVGAIKVLVAAMNFVVYHPIWALLALGVGIFVALTGASDKFRDSINKLFSGFTKLSGMDPNKMLLPDSKDRASDLEKFNKALDGTGKGMDELSKKANKASKSLLSFDEVFSLKSPDEGNAADQWEDFMGIFDGASLDLSDMQIEFPDVEGIATDFVDNLIEALGGKDKLLGAGIGSLLGAALGSIIGGPIGAKIGGILGTIAGWFWDDLANQLGLTDAGTIALPISTTLGTAIGFIAGGPLGALIGAAIGILVGWIIDSISRGIEEGDWSKIGIPVGTGLGAAIGFIAGGPLGALVGAAIGAFAGWLVNKIAEALETGDWSIVALAGGTGLGAAIGFIAGGPLGALIGAAIGALVGWITDKFIEGFSTGNWDVSGIALGLGTGLGAAIGMIAGGPVGAIIGAAIGALVGWLVGLISDNWGAISNWFKQAWSDISNWFKQAWTDITNWVKQAWTNISNWFKKAWTDITNWVKQTWTNISNWFKQAWTNISNWFKQAWTNISNWFKQAWTDITNWVKQAWTDISNWFKQAWTDISNWFKQAWTDISDWFKQSWTDISDWFKQSWTAISDWFKQAWSDVSDWFKQAWSGITNWVKQAWSDVSDWFKQAWTGITNWVKQAWTGITDWFKQAWTGITDWFKQAWTGITDWVKQAWTGITNWFKQAWTGVSDWLGNIYQSFKDWISNMWNNVFGKFFDWIDNAIDKLRNFFGLSDKVKTTDFSYTNTYVPAVNVTKGHATGGIFNREHIARFAEGNKAEAIIPLENQTAMKPFADAVANGVASVLLPIISSMNNREQVQPIYVGTLIADDRGLKELERKLQIIRLSENLRRDS